MIEELSIIIPCYNEEKRIVDTLKKIIKYCDKRVKKYEIIIVDYGSTDSIHIILNQYLNNKIRLITLQQNMGKGYAVRTGVFNAKYKWILFTDADNSTPIEMVGKLYGYANKYKLIIGSRNLKDSKRVIKQPFYRCFGGSVFPALVRMMLGIKIKDTQCGFKLMERDIAQAVFKIQEEHRFAFDVELIKAFLTLNLPVKEVAIDWYNDTLSKVKIKDMFNMFGALWKLRK